MSWGKPKPELKPEMFFKRIRDLKVLPHLKVAIYGKWETGKTYFCCSAPEPVFILDTEYGAAKVAKMHFPDKDIRIFEVRVVRTDDPTRIDYFETFKQIAMACDAIHAAFERGELEGGTVCIDNVSDIYTWLNAWTEETAAKRTSTGRPQRLEWGKRNIMYRNLIWKVLSLPCHAVVTAQMQRVYGPRGEETNNWDARWLSAQPYWCDIVIRLDKLELGPEDVRYIATVEKCRFMRALNKRIRDITWDKLVKFLRDELGLEVAS